MDSENLVPSHSTTLQDNGEAAPVPYLPCLPQELKDSIAEHLPPDGILAMRLTHPALRQVRLPPRLRNTARSKCERIAIQTYLSKPELNPTHMRCLYCKELYPVKQFNSSSSSACVPLQSSDIGLHPGVVELPQRLCAWHVGRLAKIIHTGKGGRNEWVSNMREMCMHCGTICGWGECTCKCDSCWFRTVRTYTRYLNNNVECRQFVFWRDTTATGTTVATGNMKGQLYVREHCLDPGKYLFLS